MKEPYPAAVTKASIWHIAMGMVAVVVILRMGQVDTAHGRRVVVLSSDTLPTTNGLYC